ncbi:MAG: hypothetical protein Q9157_002373 [Trypethelium eluteriae]
MAKDLRSKMERYNIYAEQLERASESVKDKWSHSDIPLLSEQRAVQPESERETFLYLAYGSNLAAETFRGRRGIKPLSQVNVVVPELRLTFDLPGVPYNEPCFANTAKRDATHEVDTLSLSREGILGSDDKNSILPLHQSKRRSGYHKNRWHKGLVGVVYEVTPSDFAHIIATEGGGISYNDILIPCYALPTDISTVPLHPDSKPFMAHTLFSPALPPGATPGHGGRLQRPDTSYAQPSARYLKLITSGAEECNLPSEYREYLGILRPYTMTSQRQRLGQTIFTMIWGPIFTVLFTVLFPRFSDDHGRAPEWLRKLAEAIFSAVWLSYDNGFKKLFGDGERTQASEDLRSTMYPIADKAAQAPVKEKFRPDMA